MFRHTYRDVDCQRVEGTWRHVFIRNAGVYYLAELVVYADGAINCGTGGLTDLDGLRNELRGGRVATTLEEGGRASAYHVANWRFAEFQTWIDADMLVGEVADEIDLLNNPPGLEGPVPAGSAGVYARGDMDYQDGPLRTLIADLGEPLPGRYDASPVTEEERAEAVEYFRQRDRLIAEWNARVPADGPAQAVQHTLT